VFVTAFDSTEQFQQQPVDVRRGEPTDLELRVPERAGSDIVVRVHSHWFHDGDAAALEVNLVSSTGGRTDAPATGALRDQFVFGSVPRGKYTVEVRHPRHVTWTKEDVVPGMPVWAQLTPNAGIALRVVDDETGGELRDYVPTLETPSTQGAARQRILTRSKTTSEAVLYAIPSGDHSLKVEVAGYESTRVPLRGLVDHETRDVVARLKSGVWVGITNTPDPNACARTAPELPEEAWLVGRLRQECEIPARGLWVRGTAVRAVDVEQRRMSSETDDRVRSLSSGPPHRNQKREDAAQEVQPDGSFRLGPYPPGFVRVELQLPGMDWSMAPRYGLTDGTSIILGDVELRAGEETVRDFVLPVGPPGRVRVHVNAECGSYEDLIVELHESWNRGPVALCALDRRGVATTAPILAGEFMLVVRPIDRGWVHVESDPVTVRSGEIVEANVNVRVFAGALRVLDAETGEHIAKAQLLLSLVHDKVQSRAVYRTDPTGSIQGLMAPGEYRAQTYDRQRGVMQSEVVIRWSPAGPAPAEITVSKPKR
jgi:hypothetical protein